MVTTPFQQAGRSFLPETLRIRSWPGKLMLQDVGMFAHSGYARLSCRHFLLPPGLDRLYLLVYVPAERGLSHASPGFHLLKQRPGFFGALVGQGLEEPGAARRIDHLVQAALLLED